jgi:hypothetical protein
MAEAPSSALSEQVERYVKIIKDAGHNVKDEVVINGNEFQIKVKIPVTKSTPKETVDNLRNKKLDEIASLFPHHVVLRKDYKLKVSLN